MTTAEKDILNGIVQTIQNQMVKIDALERALIERGLLKDGERDSYELNYLKAATSDLALLRGAIANLSLEKGAK